MFKKSKAHLTLSKLLMQNKLYAENMEKNILPSANYGVPYTYGRMYQRGSKLIQD